jgi:hypothetical protein
LKFGGVRRSPRLPVRLHSRTAAWNLRLGSREGHQGKDNGRYSRSTQTSCGLPFQAFRHQPNTRVLSRRPIFPLRLRLFHCVWRQYDKRAPQVRAAPRISGVCRLVFLRVKTFSPGTVVRNGVSGLSTPSPTEFYRCTATVASGMSALASPDEAISWAPVCFNKSFARAILSDVSQ